MLHLEVPVFDKGKEINDHLPNMTINDYLKDIRKISLFDHIIDHNVLRAHIPKQVEIDKFLDVLKQKVIHDYTLPLSAKQLRAEYKNSPFFKDIHNYISKETCCFKGNALRLFKVECENYMIFECLFFQIKPAKHKSLPPNLFLCIPESYIPHIIYLYHDNILGGHQGVDRMYWTIREKFYFPNMLPCICHASARPIASQSTVPHFPSSMDGARNRIGSKRPHPRELDNRTPPTK